MDAVEFADNSPEPPLESLYENLYVLGEGFEGYSAAASWEDAKLGIGHWSAWERIAIVTDRGWIRDALKAFGWMFPGEVKVFPVAEQPEAVAWVGA